MPESRGLGDVYKRQVMRAVITSCPPALELQNHSILLKTSPNTLTVHTTYTHTHTHARTHARTHTHAHTHTHTRTHARTLTHTHTHTHTHTYIHAHTHTHAHTHARTHARTHTHTHTHTLVFQGIRLATKSGGIRVNDPSLLWHLKSSC